VLERVLRSKLVGNTILSSVNILLTDCGSLVRSKRGAWGQKSVDLRGLVQLPLALFISSVMPTEATNQIDQLNPIDRRRNTILAADQSRPNRAKHSDRRKKKALGGARQLELLVTRPFLLGAAIPESPSCGGPLVVRAVESTPSTY